MPSQQTQQNKVDFSLIRPKNYFANERTFISWLQLAVTMGGLGLALLNFGGSGIRVRISAFVFETGRAGTDRLRIHHVLDARRAAPARAARDVGRPVCAGGGAVNFGLTFHKKAYTPPLDKLTVSLLSFGKAEH
ncbi:hypothetical protein DL89DRAFT_258564 [Linderina pennispora]|uniref:DUF202 domain-containing protein n=1 Tax=Linderina pennispora TaxID=61395 RepID=A0A1Y1W5S7_9FUNG|nr:uncharacterized protein DL89DRAFT_258564 [Linderina pennispora]ORX68718.1 hypothetical protein DL89DRAFT_258564 [Linderina pennispora]